MTFTQLMCKALVGGLCTPTTPTTQAAPACKTRQTKNMKNVTHIGFASLNAFLAVARKIEVTMSQPDRPATERKMRRLKRFATGDGTLLADQKFTNLEATQAYRALKQPRKLRKCDLKGHDHLANNVGKLYAPWYAGENKLSFAMETPEAAPTKKASKPKATKASKPKATVAKHDEIANALIAQNASITFTMVGRDVTITSVSELVSLACGLRDENKELAKELRDALRTKDAVQPTVTLTL